MCCKPVELLIILVTAFLSEITPLTQGSKFPAQNFSILKFIILNMITVSCRFAHSFKIMRIPQNVIPFRVLPQPVQALLSGRGGKIDVPYICCLDGRVPEAYELWDFAQDGFREFHPSARVRILYDLREDTFHTHFFNARRFQIPFMGSRSTKTSDEFLDAGCATQQVGSRVPSWKENSFVHSWGNYPTMKPHTIYTITRYAYNAPVTPNALVLRANNKRLRLKHVEWRRTRHRELLTRIRQDMRNEVRASLSDDSDDGWLEGSNSDL